MTTGTDPHPESGSAEERARKAVRARRLTDPLGAMGQRHPGQRLEREARARRATFAGSLAVFAVAFGLVSMPAPPEEPAAGLAPAVALADGGPALPANGVIPFEPQPQAFAPAEPTKEPRVRAPKPRKERPVYARTRSS